MKKSENKEMDQHSYSEDLLRNRLINNLMVTWSIACVVAYIVVLFRAMELGWCARDTTHSVLISIIIVVTLFRHKLSTCAMARFLITINMIIGIMAVYSFGMTSGGVVFMPMAAVIVALFYPQRMVVIFVGLSMFFLCILGIGISSGQIKLPISTDMLHTSYAQWIAFILGVGLFYWVSCLTILSYRQEMGMLIADVNNKRDRLEEANRDLQKALDEIKTLRGILPLCSFCKKVRNDKGYWEQVDVYLHNHSEADVSHGLCPECFEENYPEVYKKRFQTDDEE